MRNSDRRCEECYSHLPAEPIMMLWYGVLYHFCQKYCKTTWHMKAIARFNMEKTE